HQTECGERGAQTQETASPTNVAGRYEERAAARYRVDEAVRRYHADGEPQAHGQHLALSPLTEVRACCDDRHEQDARKQGDGALQVVAYGLSGRGTQLGDGRLPGSYRRAVPPNHLQDGLGQSKRVWCVVALGCYGVGNAERLEERRHLE